MVCGTTACSFIFGRNSMLWSETALAINFSRKPRQTPSLPRSAAATAFEICGLMLPMSRPPHCSLLHFGGLFMATQSKRPEQIMPEVRQIHAECSRTEPPSRNPALQLAAYLSSSISNRRSYLALVVSPSLIPYARRLSQLVGGSLAHGSSGLLPLIWTNHRFAASFAFRRAELRGRPRRGRPDDSRGVALRR